MTDTPRTDAACFDGVCLKPSGDEHMTCVPVSFAQDLERELVEVRASRDDMVRTVNSANQRTDRQRSVIGDLTHKWTMARHEASELRSYALELRRVVFDVVKWHEAYNEPLQAPIALIDRARAALAKNPARDPLAMTEPELDGELRRLGIEPEQAVRAVDAAFERATNTTHEIRNSQPTLRCNGCGECLRHLEGCVNANTLFWNPLST